MPAVTRFFRNARGERLAYAVNGIGAPLVFPAWWVSHVERNAEDAAFADFFQRLGETFRCVRYDRFGVGLSDRGRRDYTLQTELQDFEALVDALAEPKVHLFAFSCGAPIALAYAAEHPKRVDRVVCYGGYADGARVGTPELRRVLASLVRAHWGMGAKALADVFYPGADAESLNRFAALQRDASDAESAARLLELTYAMDASAWLEKVDAPVLVLHRRGDRAIPHEMGRDLATRLKNASFVTLEGNVHLPWAGDASALLKHVRAFLGAESATDARETALLRRDGEVWTVRYAGREVLLREVKGLVDLARLLSRPGEEMHVLDFLEESVRAEAAGASKQPMADRRALADYRARLTELDTALEDARRCGAHPGQTERLEEEKEALLHQLRAATGLGGKARGLKDPVERARKAVTARIRDAIRRIRAAHPELGAHLQEAILTGVSCAYRPSPPVRWSVSPEAF